MHVFCRSPLPSYVAQISKVYGNLASRYVIAKKFSQVEALYAASKAEISRKIGFWKLFEMVLTCFFSGWIYARI